MLILLKQSLSKLQKKLIKSNKKAFYFIFGKFSFKKIHFKRFCQISNKLNVMRALSFK
jgi:hypothetical protein